MSKAGSVATELRKLADALDVQPDAEITKPYVWFVGHDKEYFLSLVRLMPRPLKKSVAYPGEKYAKLEIGYENPAISVTDSIPQSLTCELVEPAKPAVYRCAPILSEEEDAALEVTA